MREMGVTVNGSGIHDEAIEVLLCSDRARWRQLVAQCSRRDRRTCLQEVYVIVEVIIRYTYLLLLLLNVLVVQYNSLKNSKLSSYFPTVNISPMPSRKSDYLPLV